MAKRAAGSGILCGLRNRAAIMAAGNQW